MRIGSQEKPLTSSDAMKVARSMVKDLFETPGGGQGLWWMGGTFWLWRAGKWEARGLEQMKNEVWRWLEDAWVVGAGSDGSSIRKFVLKGSVVRDVVEALCAAVECPWADVPVWTREREGRPAPGTCVAFEDCVVSVAGGKVEVLARDESWLDGVVVPVAWEPGAKCPRWERALREWSDGDEKWAQLLQRVFGYVLMSKRSYRKWVLLEGRSQGGKGVIAHVMQRLVGKQAWFTASLTDLGGDFGLDGVEHARVLSIAEFNKADEMVRQKAARVMKNVVGEDEITVNIKNVRQKRGLRVRAVPVVQSNMVPQLPNESEGLSSKMLILPFTVTFRSNPQFDLKEVLEGELAGIAAWALEGARLLEAEGGKVWPEPTAAKDVRLRFRVSNNPLEAFVEARFEQSPEGFVPGPLIWREWQDFVQRNQIKTVVPRNQLLLKIEEDCTWNVMRARKRVGEGQVRGLQGVLLRKVVDDDI